MKKPAVHTTESLKARCTEEGDCWLWDGYLGNGVPMVHHEGKMVAVRKLLTALAGKSIKRGAYFSPSCGNALCVCPDHIVRRSQNEHSGHMARMLAQSPANDLRILKLTQTRRSRYAKLTLDDARMARASTESSQKVAEKLGVTKALIARIRRGVQWKDHANPFGGLMR